MAPDTVNIDDILNVDVTPLSSIFTSGPDMSVAMSCRVRYIVGGRFRRSK